MTRGSQRARSVWQLGGQRWATHSVAPAAPPTLEPGPGKAPPDETAAQAKLELTALVADDGDPVVSDEGACPLRPGGAL